MTKTDLVEQLHLKTNLSLQESFDVLEAVLSIVKSALESGEKIKISGFGNIEVKNRRDRRGRNPMTGENITIESRRIQTEFASTSIGEILISSKTGGRKKQEVFLKLE